MAVSVSEARVTGPVDLTVLRSAEDSSVNFVAEGEFPGTVEARYVRRSDDYFIVYLSSQTGCRKACRFCHLTQTGQTDFVDVTLDGFFDQADQVLAHYDTQQPAEQVHFNWMSRGEAFACSTVLERAPALLAGLSDRATARGLWPKFKFSTIMPEQEMAGRSLQSVFCGWAPDVYYSLYSMDPAFRRRWLPKAMDPDRALEKLVAWQQASRKVPVLHWAFIEGENDDERTVSDIVAAVNRHGLRCDFNVVRYNPFSAGQGCEPDVQVIDRNAAMLADGVPGADVKIVGRVGFDVKASCGMFVGGRDRRAVTAGM
jgi:adenine C2-methylase RlmN of 23S rRNA A2503 and tRNA A37